jgi:hypothetical protein
VNETDCASLLQTAPTAAGASIKVAPDSMVLVRAIGAEVLAAVPPQAAIPMLNVNAPSCISRIRAARVERAPSHAARRRHMARAVTSALRVGAESFLGRLRPRAATMRGLRRPSVGVDFQSTALL